MFCNPDRISGSKLGGIDLARRRKRKSRRRQEGRKILEHIPQFSIDSGEDKPVTAARKYIHTHGILPPGAVACKTQRTYNRSILLGRKRTIWSTVC